MLLFPCRPLYRSFPELYTCPLFYLNIQPVSFDQNRRSRSAMGISISLEKCLNLSSISRYFFLVRDAGISSTIPSFLTFRRMCLLSIANYSPCPMFRRKWLASLYPRPFTFSTNPSLLLNGLYNDLVCSLK